ncbi:translation elongation factor G [Neoconidiobolus thromboides FSU 785]|nr:translation elongation factor G [Neoconidiobolus thromboides FSU 785]
MLLNTFKSYLNKTTLTKQIRINNRKFTIKSILNYNENFNLIRNIGIIAHIDAGKTTTTERMLYYSGYTKRMGEVHTGDTIMDYMPAERERGITIGSACITFPWKGNKINLIDTPGHVDFTMEVERSIRVLDGAVTILDAVSGVQAQTETVWKQADKYEVPRIIFINKLDRPGADFNKSINMIEEKLKVQSIKCQLPILINNKVKNQDELVGLLDLVKMKRINFEIGKNEGGWEDKHIIKEVEFTQQEKEIAAGEREKMIEMLAEIDDIIMDIYLEKGDLKLVNNDEVKAAIKRVCLSNLAVPILCGSSLKNIGIQPLLDSVIDYLPSPKDKKAPIAINSHGEKQVINIDNDKLTCGLAFKVIYDVNKGPITFIRLYSGTLTNKSNIINCNNQKKERIQKLYQIYADEYKEIPSISAGNIVVAIGLKHTKTGDTLIFNQNSQNNFIKLKEIELPSPVFVCSIEPYSISDEKDLLKTLNYLNLEDPSLQIKKDEESGQILLYGMGELHLEIIKERLINELKVKAEIGKVFISYRETIGETIKEDYMFEDFILNRLNKCNVSLKLEPLLNENDVEEETDEGNNNLITLHNDSSFIHIHSSDGTKINTDNLITLKDAHKSIIDGITTAISRGGPNGYLLTKMKININSIQLYQDNNFKSTIAQAVYKAVQEAIIKKENSAMIKLLEPKMKVIIQSNRKYFGSLLNDLNNNRNAKILACENDMQSENTTITCLVPLSNLIGYSSTLRSISNGNASFTMSQFGYGVVNKNSI